MSTKNRKPEVSRVRVADLVSSAQPGPDDTVIEYKRLTETVAEFRERLAREAKERGE